MSNDKERLTEMMVTQKGMVDKNIENEVLERARRMASLESFKGNYRGTAMPDELYDHMVGDMAGWVNQGNQGIDELRTDSKNLARNIAEVNIVEYEVHKIDSPFSIIEEHYGFDNINTRGGNN